MPFRTRTISISGRNLAIDFVEEVLPDAARDVERMFSRRGAYANFKNLLERRKLLERWDEYETAADEKALREWCADQGIQIDDSVARFDESGA